MTRPARDARPCADRIKASILVAELHQADPDLAEVGEGGDGLRLPPRRRQRRQQDRDQKYGDDSNDDEQLDQRERGVRPRGVFASRTPMRLLLLRLILIAKTWRCQFEVISL